MKPVKYWNWNTIVAWVLVSLQWVAIGFVFWMFLSET